MESRCWHGGRLFDYHVNDKRDSLYHLVSICEADDHDI